MILKSNEEGGALWLPLFCPFHIRSSIPILYPYTASYTPNQIDLSSFFSSFGIVFSTVIERAPCMDAKN